MSFYKTYQEISYISGFSGESYYDVYPQYLETIPSMITYNKIMLWDNAGSIMLLYNEIHKFNREVYYHGTYSYWNIPTGIFQKGNEWKGEIYINK